MSMDQQYRQMVEFTKALESFDQKLLETLRDLEDRHEAISPLWQDDTRRAYDREWQPFYDRIRNYLRRESPQVQQFLQVKIRYLERYLRGG